MMKILHKIVFARFPSKNIFEIEGDANAKLFRECTIIEAASVQGNFVGRVVR
jgi:hypothetical protein